MGPFRGLVLDLDGTVLRGSPGSVDAGDAKAIAQLVCSGVPVVIATGRPVPLARPIAEHLHIREAIVALDGAVTLDLANNELVTVPMDAPVYEALLAFARDHDWHAHTLTAAGAFSDAPPTRRLPDVGPYLQPHSGQDTTPLQLRLDPRAATKPTADQLWTFVQSRNLASWVCGRRATIMCMNARADKGAALRALAQRRGWRTQDFIAVADGIMDVPLFETVGAGVAVGTRCEQLCSLAIETVRPDQPGLIAKVIAKHLEP